MTIEDELRHGAARNRALRRTFLSNATLQAVTVLGALVSLPFVTRTLSGPEFGVVATMTGFQALLALADLGVGTALTFKIADALARGDDREATVLVASGLVVTTICALCVVAVGCTAALALPWASLLNTGDMPATDVALSVASAATTIGVSIVGSIGYRLLFALQRGSVVGWAMLAATAVSSAATVLVTTFDPPAYAVILTMLGVPGVVSLGVTFIVVGRAHGGSLKPGPRDVSRVAIRSLVGTSRWFWLISLAGALAFQTDTLIVAGFISATTAGVYAIVLRLFGLVNQTIQPWVLQLGPAFADALARGHIPWLKTQLIRSTVVAVTGSAVAGFGIVLLAPTVVSLWLGPDLAPTRSLLVPAALWTAVILGAEPMFLLLQALGRLRFHAIAAWVMAVTNISLSVWFTMRWGAVGPLWGSLVSSILCVAAPGYLAVRPYLVEGGRALSTSPPENPAKPVT